MKPYFPEDMSPPTVEQRRKFYRDEFERWNLKVLNFKWERPVLAVDVGTESTRYRPKHKDYLGKIVFIREYRNLDHLVKKIVGYAPEDLYYDTRTYDRDPRQTNAIWERPSGKQLVFDLDPELVECRHCERIRKNNEGKRFAKYTFCEDCFSELAGKTAKLVVFLRRNFDSINIYFSGRGFHVHVNDQEAFEMDDFDRETLAEKLSKRFPIDRKITAGEKNLIRMPGSLHGLTGRKVVEVGVEELKNPEMILHDKSVPDVFRDEV